MTMESPMNLIWLVVFRATPWKNDGLGQLGWFYMTPIWWEKSSIHVPNHQPVIISPCFTQHAAKGKTWRIPPFAVPPFRRAAWQSWTRHPLQRPGPRRSPEWVLGSEVSCSEVFSASGCFRYHWTIDVPLIVVNYLDHSRHLSTRNRFQL